MGLTVWLGLGQEVNSRQTITDDDMCHERNSVPRQRRDEGSIRAQAVFSEEMAFQLRLDGSAIRGTAGSASQAVDSKFRP